MQSNKPNNFQFENEQDEIIRDSKAELKMTSSEFLEEQSKQLANFNKERIASGTQRVGSTLKLKDTAAPNMNIMLFNPKDGNTFKEKDTTLNDASKTNESINSWASVLELSKKRKIGGDSTGLNQSKDNNQGTVSRFFNSNTNRTNKYFEKKVAERESKKRKIGGNSIGPNQSKQIQFSNQSTVSKFFKNSNPEKSNKNSESKATEINDAIAISSNGGGDVNTVEKSNTVKKSKTAPLEQITIGDVTSGNYSDNYNLKLQYPDFGRLAKHTQQLYVLLQTCSDIYTDDNLPNFSKVGEILGLTSKALSLLEFNFFKMFDANKWSLYPDGIIRSNFMMANRMNYQERNSEFILKQHDGDRGKFQLSKEEASCFQNLSGPKKEFLTLLKDKRNFLLDNTPDLQKIFLLLDLFEDDKTQGSIVKMYQRLSPTAKDNADRQCYIIVNDRCMKIVRKASKYGNLQSAIGDIVHFENIVPTFTHKNKENEPIELSISDDILLQHPGIMLSSTTMRNLYILLQERYFYQGIGDPDFTKISKYLKLEGKELRKLINTFNKQLRETKSLATYTDGIIRSSFMMENQIDVNERNTTFILNEYNMNKEKLKLTEDQKSGFPIIGEMKLNFLRFLTSDDYILKNNYPDFFKIFYCMGILKDADIVKRMRQFFATNLSQNKLGILNQRLQKSNAESPVRNNLGMNTNVTLSASEKVFSIKEFIEGHIKNGIELQEPNFRRFPERGQHLYILLQDHKYYQGGEVDFSKIFKEMDVFLEHDQHLLREALKNNLHKYKNWKVYSDGIIRSTFMFDNGMDVSQRNIKFIENEIENERSKFTFTNEEFAALSDVTSNTKLKLFKLLKNPKNVLKDPSNNPDWYRIFVAFGILSDQKAQRNIKDHFSNAISDLDLIIEDGRYSVDTDKLIYLSNFKVEDYIDEDLSLELQVEIPSYMQMEPMVQVLYSLVRQKDFMHNGVPKWEALRQKLKIESDSVLKYLQNIYKRKMKEYWILSADGTISFKIRRRLTSGNIVDPVANEYVEESNGISYMVVQR
ncbi:uncharacterized protein KGF55_005028 [Candida pseudojiufengensis]|uniref:uncharacterized protein n=1 Tax=Candida pseudojiufengensis TaxID=497109 RepID=UPI0022241115|nr:uncharacterized protein KGF55_005028 [Candida pseudojiufengensis]KAI5959796.1 hypothetical protein KGF55_005028 [Candida pseudojiufengensis]